jgi:hypothetical protein
LPPSIFSLHQAIAVFWISFYSLFINLDGIFIIALIAEEIVCRFRLWH